MYYCIKYLKRHPIETDLTLDQIAEIAYVAKYIEKNEAEQATAIVKALIGSRI